ncbi:MAG: DUF192 domain-containing protein [Candidatus Pacebacteria bacterium]|nr:DUF192 domain-containing protein [Candidatus Paceibacterota bacterium]
MKPCTVFYPSRRFMALALVMSLVGGLFLPQPLLAASAKVITIQSQKFTVEIADDNETRQKGLMGRRSLAPNHGMLFLYSRPMSVEMWMKDTPLALDMVFINSHHRISHIVHDAKPFSTTTIPSNGEVIAVIEFTAGTAKRKGLKIGDRVEY